MFDIMNRQIVVAREANEVMLVTLVIAHEDVLAMHTSIVVPPAFGFLNSLTFGVIVGRKGDVVFLQIAQHVLLPFGYDVVPRSRTVSHRDTVDLQVRRYLFSSPPRQSPKVQRFSLR